jgi:hypothetical protein
MSRGTSDNVPRDMLTILVSVIISLPLFPLSPTVPEVILALPTLPRLDGLIGDQAMINPIVGTEDEAMENTVRSKLAPCLHVAAETGKAAEQHIVVG